MKKRFMRAFRAVGEHARDTKGNVAILTALTLPVLLLSIGGGMDYARALDARA